MTLPETPSPPSHQFWGQPLAGLYSSQTHFSRMYGIVNNFPQVSIGTRNSLAAGLPSFTDFQLRTKSSRRTNKPEARVTIIIGIICRDGIVLASDSQTTSVASGTRNKYAQKIHRIWFENETCALVAEAGMAHVSATVIEIIERMAR